MENNASDLKNSDFEISRSNFLLKEGDGLKLYDRIYKVTAIRDNGDRIILKRLK